MIPPVLLVEDDPVAAAVVTQRLEELRLANPLKVVFDIPDAIAWLGAAAAAPETKPALILLDMHLPGGTGIDLLQWLRAEARLADTPVLMLTASSALAEINQAHELGIVSYLVKPVGLAALGEIIKELRLPWALVHGEG
jgi:CheY-like chemotaxis protein